MLAMASADYQYHNTMFLVAHFHNTIIPGVVYAMLAGLTYWWPKMFGFMLNEKIGKWSFWFIAIGFNVTFFPMYITGLDGQARRMYTYSEATGYGLLNMLSFVGAGLWQLVSLYLYITFITVFVILQEILVSDPWDARSLEWATHTPVPEYNFAITPQVDSSQAFWDAKKKGHELFPGKVEEIHMPNNSGVPFIMSCIFFVWGFSLVFSMWIRLQLFPRSESLLVWLTVHLKKITDIIFLWKKLKKQKKNCEVLNNENRSLTST